MARLTFRKSFRLGPIRSTLSNRGVSNSIGYKGLRLTADRKTGGIAAFILAFVAVLSALL